MSGWLVCLLAVVRREALRFVHQRERFLAALVRPLVWLVVFAAGFRAALGLSIIPPYETYVTYETYIVPGLCGMIQLFNGMQSSLSLVYDRETGSMRLMLTSPLPRWWLLFCKLAAGCAISILQVYAFLAIAGLYGIAMPWEGYLWALPALVLNGLMLGALGLLLSSTIDRLENFAGVMNFVIFPMFFLSTALSALEDGRELGAAGGDRRGQSLHLRGRADSLRALRQARAGGAALDGARLRGLRRRGGLGLRPRPRPDPAARALIRGAVRACAGPGARLG